MQQSHQEVVTSGNQPQYEYRSTQNLGLPINSRLIAQPNPNLYLNNYQIANQPVSPQQVYTNIPSSNTVRVSNAGYQSIINPVTSYTTVPTTPIAYEQSNIYQSNLGMQRGSQQVVRSRMVPVTQYIPVYEIENVQNVPMESQVIHQRVIQHEPQAFKDRQYFQEHQYFEEKLGAGPTLMEQIKVEQSVPQMVNTKIVRVSQDPLVETVPGAWRSKVSASRSASYVPPAPLPRQEKSCCSGWLLLLLGLIALAGVLAAIFVGKNAFSSSSEQKSAEVAQGTKVSSATPSLNIKEVAPLTDASFEVKGSTAVTTPVAFLPNIKSSNVVPTSYVAPTEISIPAKTSSEVQQVYVQPQQMSFVPVKPMVVNPIIEQTQPLNNIQPLSTTPSTVKVQTVAPTTVIPQTIAPQAVTPSSVAPTPVSNPTYLAANPSTSPTKLFQSQLIPATTIQPTSVPTSTVLPASIAPLTVQPYSTGVVSVQPVRVSSVQPTANNEAGSTSTTVSTINPAVSTNTIPTTSTSSSKPSNMTNSQTTTVPANNTGVSANKTTQAIPISNATVIANETAVGEERGFVLAKVVDDQA